jgi:hypothetical protein
LQLGWMKTNKKDHLSLRSKHLKPIHRPDKGKAVGERTGSFLHLGFPFTNIFT